MLTWILSEEDIPKLKAGEREAVDKFYFGNYERIQRMAYGYQRRMQERYGNGGAYDPEDLMQNCYLDIPTYDFSNNENLTQSIFNSFYWGYFGGDWYVRMYNPKLKNGNYQIFPLFIIDNIVDENQKLGEGVNDFFIIDKYCYLDDPHTELEIISEEERQNKIFDDLPDFLAQILNFSQVEYWLSGFNSLTIVNALKKHANEVIEFLRAHGCTDPRLDGRVETDEDVKRKSNNSFT